MLQLAAIYTLTFSSVGMLALGLVPELHTRLNALLHRRSERAGRQLAVMFLETTTKRLFLASLASPFLGAVVGWLILSRPVSAAIGAVVGLVLPGLVVSILRSTRRKRFNAQLVDALLMLSSSLKAGLSILQAFEVLVEEMGPPLSQEIGLALKETRMGAGIEEALTNLKRRMPSDDLTLVVTAILVARETGGDVTRVFGNLVETIRDRQKLKEKVRNLTLMPRMQGLIMAALPFAFGSLAISMNPRYFEVLLHDPVGTTVLAIAGGAWLLSLGMVWLFSRSPVL